MTTPNAPRNPMAAPAATAPKAAPKGPGGPGGPGTPFGRPDGDDDFVINLEGADLSSRHVPEGAYYAYCSNIARGESKAGNPMITWDFTLYGGEHEGKTLKVFTALTPEAMWKFIEVCNAVAFPFPEDKRPKFGAVKEAALRTLVIVHIADTEYNNAVQSQITTVLPHDQEPGKRIPDAGVPRA